MSPDGRGPEEALTRDIISVIGLATKVSSSPKNFRMGVGHAAASVQRMGTGGVYSSCWGGEGQTNSPFTLKKGSLIVATLIFFKSWTIWSPNLRNLSVASLHLQAVPTLPITGSEFHFQAGFIAPAPSYGWVPLSQI